MKNELLKLLAALEGALRTADLGDEINELCAEAQALIERELVK